MSVCGQTEEDAGSEEMGVPARDAYEAKAVSKVVRVLTVLAYLLSVSLAAILLSVYYVCVWKSPELPFAEDTVEVAARRVDLPPHPHHGSRGFRRHHDRRVHSDTGPEEPHLFHSVIGGSNITMSENVTQQLANVTDDSFWNMTDGGESNSPLEEAMADLSTPSPLNLSTDVNGEPAETDNVT